MSIGVGVLCRDAWILLFADRQIGTGDFKFYQRKISLIGLSRGIVGYTYAGLSDVNNTVFEEFGKRIRDADMTVAEVKRELQKTLNAVLNEQTSPFQMLVGVDSERPAMFKTFDKAISPVYLHDFIGFGDSALVRYLSAALLKADKDPWKQQAMLFGVYVLSQAKKYVHGCGGDTDVVGLFCGDAYELPSRSLERMENQFDQFEQRASEVLVALTHDSISQELFDKTVGDFARHLQEVREQFRMIQLRR